MIILTDATLERADLTKAIVETCRQGEVRCARNAHAVLQPDLPPRERTMAQLEGWILRLAGSIR
jgi:hypothetical protein